jgi:large subunit ribosomal protein L23
MKDARDIIIAPIISENTMDLSVNVINVNTMNVRGKKRRLGFHVGKKPDWKKALVKLAEGDEIEIYEGL